jgi:hypothetical protein
MFSLPPQELADLRALWQAPPPQATVMARKQSKGRNSGSPKERQRQAEQHKKRTKAKKPGKRKR